MEDFRDKMEERGQLIDKMHEIRDEAVKDGGKGWTATRRLQFDEAKQKVEKLTAEIDNELRGEKAIPVLDDSTTTRTIGNHYHPGHGTDYTGSELGLRRDQKVSEFVRGNPAFNASARQTKPGLSLGDCVRGMFYPDKVGPDVRTALNEGTDSQGGFLTPTILAAQVIDKLRANLVTIQAGASTVPLQSNVNDYARLDTDPTGSWLAESTTGPVVDAVFGRVQFAPKTYRGVFLFSGEIAQDAPNLNQVLDRAINQSFARPIDGVALNSTGGNAPVGILQTTGVTTTNLTTNNNTITNWSLLNNAVDRLRRNNVSPTAAIMHPRDYGKFTTLSSTADGQPLMRSELIRDLPLLDTTQMPITRDVAGTTSNTGSSMVVGNFRDLVLGTRLDLRLFPLPNYKAEKYQHGLLAVVRLDWKLFHDESFDVTDKFATT